MKKYLLRELFFILGLVITTSCVGVVPGDPLDSTTGESSGDSVTEIISADEGGSITSSDGKLTLTIPPGALEEDTEITIRAVETDAGTVYEFERSGLVFKEPATAAFEIDLAERKEMVMLFLLNDDGTAEMLETSLVESDEDSSVVRVTTQIPHFTSLLAVTGNSFYAYLTSLGTHYAGSSFKADLSVRYLGFEHTRSYKEMSLAYKTLGITVKKIRFETSGQIEIVTPNPITRDDFLSRKGQESATRPTFHCKDPGDGTVKATVEVTGVVEVTFQPENKTRAYTVNASGSTTRQGECVAPSIGLNDSGTTGSEEVSVAVADPAGDVLIDYNDTLVPAIETGQEAPGFIDIELVSLDLVGGNELSATIRLAGNAPNLNPDNVPFLSFDLLILDPAVGETILAPFFDALWDLSIDALGAGSALSPRIYHWNGEYYEDRDDLPLEGGIVDRTVSLSVPLEALGLTAAEAESGRYRAVTQMQMIHESGVDYFIDTADLEFNNL